VRPSDVLAREPACRGTVQVVTDRTTTAARDEGRLIEALSVAFERGGGALRVSETTGRGLDFSRELRCDGCGTAYRKPSPGLFSFNSPIGACDECRGFGRTIGVDWAKVIDRTKSIADGALKPWSGKAAKHERKLLLRHCARVGIATDVPVARLGEAQVRTLIDGDGGNWRTGYPGLKRWFTWLETRAYKMHVRVLLARYRSYDTCRACSGMRWKRDVLGYRALGMTLPEFSALEVGAARERVRARRARGPEDDALRRVLEELDARLCTLCDVGLSYLTLDRSARTLSGGELQRVALATALDSRLTGMLFALDEPTFGLHAADVERLVPVVKRLSAAGNIALVVESNERFVTAADRVVELGPFAGEHGGEIVFDGTPAELSSARTATARALRGSRRPAPRPRRVASGRLRLSGATGNNLRQVDLELPLAVLTCVTGVSGSGKSSLIGETLVPAVQRALGLAHEAALPYGELEGALPLTRVIAVDQAPLGRTSRGNAATYLGVWDALRKRFASTPLAKTRGYKPGMFSFNVAGGRCEACKGEGSETVEMQFLADVRFSCPECGGWRGR
jgi:excinuclease ABC subunit A